MRVGLLGCGCVGREIANYFKERPIEGLVITAVFDKNRKRAAEVAKLVRAEVASSAEELIDKSDIVVEAASQEAVEKYAERILAAGRSLVVLSTGALLKEGLLSKLTETAERNNARLYLPSGAILGVDGLKAAALGLQRAVLTIRKNPQSLGLSDDEEKPVYEGSAREVVERFRRDVNLASTLALALGSPERILVRVIADPKAKGKNLYELEFEGELGRYRITAENVAFNKKPRNSKIAAYSVIQLLKELIGVVRIG